MGQKYAAYDDEGRITAYYDSEDSPPPEGATVVEITYDEWVACLTTPGYTVVNGELVPPAPPTPDEVAAELASAVREQRNAALRLTDWVVTRHRDQESGSLTPSLTVEEYAAVLEYRQALRDVPAQPGFPHTVVMPVSPL